MNAVPRLPEDDPRRVKAEAYHARIKTLVWETFVAEFQKIAADGDVDWSLLNKAAIGAFLDCAVAVAVDEGLGEDVLAHIVRVGHRAAYAAAPKFG